MDSRSLIDRLKPDPSDELVTLTNLLRASKWPAFPAAMERHFEVARRRPRSFTEHAPVLGLSIGGTNTKVMLGSMDTGRLRVEHLVALKNPESPVHWEDFFHSLLFEDAVIRSYLIDEKNQSVGVSFPMAVIDGVPYHRTKIPTILDLVARELPRQHATHGFRNRFASFLRERGAAECRLVYQGDGIVAHHGALSLADVDPDGKSVLLICGTGLATGDERNYVQVGIAEILSDDDELYPREETENRQYHYAVAGKGLFGLMARALTVQSRQAGSALEAGNVRRLFQSAEDSRTVVEIGTCRKLPASEVTALRLRLGMESSQAWEEMVSVGEAIVERVIESIANTLLATIIDMGPAANGAGHVTFFEGSIARNPVVLHGVRAAIDRRLADTSLWRRCGFPKPLDPIFDQKLPEPIMTEAVSPDAASDVDLTLIGTVTSAAANDI